MKIVILIQITLTLLFVVDCQAESSVGGIEADKIAHFSASFAGQVGCAAIVQELTESKLASNAVCAAAMAGVGLATEMGAFGSNKFDVYDLGADAAGIAAGALIVQWRF